MRSNGSPEQIEREIAETRAEIDDTLDALSKKLSPGQILDHALRYVRGEGGEFGANLSRTVRDNPVPVALLGVSVGWLALSGQGRRHPHRSTDVAGRVKGKADELAKRVGAPAGRASERASELAGDAQKRAGSLAEQASELGHDAAHRLEETYGRVGDYADQARRKVADAQEAAVQLLHDNPIVVGALALAAGAALAAMLPHTRQEDELLGEQGERLRAAAEDTAAKGAESAKSAASAAVEAARENVVSEHPEPKGEPASGPDRSPTGPSANLA